MKEDNGANIKIQRLDNAINDLINVIPGELWYYFRNKRKNELKIKEMEIIGTVYDEIRTRTHNKKSIKKIVNLDDKGGVYFLKVLNTNYYKIGITKSFDSRINTISSYCPLPVIVLNLKYIDQISASAIEQTFLKKYRDYKLRGEWFLMDDGTAQKFLDDLHSCKINIFKNYHNKVK